MSEREYVWQAVVRSGVFGGAALSLLVTLLVIAAEPSVLHSGVIVQAPMWAMMPCGLLCALGGWVYGLARVRQRTRAAAIALVVGALTLSPALYNGVMTAGPERGSRDAMEAAWLLVLGMYGTGLLIFAGWIAARSRRQ